jgi:hypothetical protein
MWKVWVVNLWWTQKTKKAQAGKPFILNWLVTDLTIELLIITVPANIINITYLIYCYWASAQSLHIQTLLMYFPLFSCPCFSTSASNESVTGALHLTQVGTKFTNVTYTSSGESKCCLHSLQLMISLKDKGTSTGIIIKKYI